MNERIHEQEQADLRKSRLVKFEADGAPKAGA
jgi:hypothetical protein